VKMKQDIGFLQRENDELKRRLNVPINPYNMRPRMPPVQNPLQGFQRPRYQERVTG
jgi:hypothetical protein